MQVYKDDKDGDGKSELANTNQIMFMQACGSNEENHGNRDGRWRRIGSAYVSHNIFEVCSIRHTNG
jgi:hypothetical protein